MTDERKMSLGEMMVWAAAYARFRSDEHVAGHAALAASAEVLVFRDEDAMKLLRSYDAMLRQMLGEGDEPEEWPEPHAAEARVNELEQQYDDVRACWKAAEKRIADALALLDEGFYEEGLGRRFGYDLQAVNQAHRILAGGDPPRETKLDSCVLWVRETR